MADISHAELGECGTSVVAVCPWHKCSFFSNVVIPPERLVGMTSIQRLGRVKQGGQLARTPLKSESGMTLKTVSRICSWNLSQEEVTGVQSNYAPCRKVFHIIVFTTEFADPPPSVPKKSAAPFTNVREAKSLVPGQALTTLMQ